MALKDRGMSNRTIGSILGVDPKTVRNDLQAASTNVEPVPERVTGPDGKSYPVTVDPVE